MFAAAMVDARPALAEPVLAALAALDLPADVTWAFRPHDDGTLTGRRFVVQRPAPAHATAASVLARALAASRLAPPVRARAQAMLDSVAEAEAAVHGIPAADVKFHELGGWDTLVDFAAAAAAIEGLGAASWSCGVLPRGRGTVETAHGTLPVPTPAVVLLLEGFVVDDDGVDGERITPTGAAILRHLAPAQAADPTPRRLAAAGHGFGTRTLSGRSNVLRVSLYEDAAQAAGVDRVTLLGFDVDDQTPEDLAVAIQRLRAAPGVVDVVQHALVGKHGRQAVRVELLVRPDAAEAAVRLCFLETTTLGVRRQTVERLVLDRETVRVDGPGAAVRVKIAARPDGRRTAKAEMADARAAGGHGARMERRAAAERRALAVAGDDDGD